MELNCNRVQLPTLLFSEYLNVCCFVEGNFGLRCLGRMHPYKACRKSIITGVITPPGGVEQHRERDFQKISISSNFFQKFFKSTKCWNTFRCGWFERRNFQLAASAPECGILIPLLPPNEMNNRQQRNQPEDDVKKKTRLLSATANRRSAPEFPLNPQLTNQLKPSQLD